MLKRFYFILIPFLLAAAVSLAGCSDEPALPEVSPVPAGMEQREVYVRLHLNIAESGIPDSRSRADAVEEPGLTPGSSREEMINSIELLICDAEDGNETLLDIIALAAPQIGIIRANKTLGLNLSLPVGRKVHIYLLVNVPVSMYEHFVVGRSVYEAVYVSGGADYWDLINEFVPASDGQQEILEKKGTGAIPMTGQCRDLSQSGAAASTDPFAIVIPDDNSSKNPMQFGVDLCRMVAKAHVLVKSLIAGARKIEYVYALDMKAASETETGSQTTIDAKWLGWIRKDSVRYTPNAVNRSTYILPHKSDNGEGWVDLNMDLEAYLSGGMARNLEFNAPIWGHDFIFYSGADLHRDNIRPNRHYAPVESYDKTLHDNTVNGKQVPNRYTRGMYCPENYFVEPPAPEVAAKFDEYDDAMPIVTHLSIAAKLTPRWIVLHKNFMERMDNFVKEYDNNIANFLEKYGLDLGDFGKEDVERWKYMREHYSEYLTGDTYCYRKDFRFIQLDTERDAMDILSWSLMTTNLWSNDPADFDKDKFPDGTYYSYDLRYDSTPTGEISGVNWTQQYIYLAAGAVALAVGDNADIKTYSVPHLGGWGYYYTYVTNNQIAGGKVPYKASQVTRNTYYLITVSNFGNPGGTVTRPEYIKVNTVPVGWDNAGRGDIYLQ